MQQRRFLTFILVGCFFSAITTALAQQNLRTQLFSEADELLKQSKEKHADIYGPKSFEQAMEYYSEAEDAFQRGKDVEDIRERLKNAAAYFAKAIDACKLGEVTFSAAMSARNDAMSADAAKHTPDHWNTAEVQFKRAAQELEDGDVNAAKRLAPEVEASYRTAELEAIKANYLAPARDLLRQAEQFNVQETAPKTLDKAKKLVARVEDLLKQNRYDTDEARQLAEEAKYEAAHALNLHKTITQMKVDERKYEDVLLSYEAQFQRIAEALGIIGRFEKGFDGPVSEMVAAIKQRDAKAAKDVEALRQADENLHNRESEIANLKQQISSMQTRVGTLTDTEKDLQTKLQSQYQQEATVRSVTNMFLPEEGNVFREGDNVVIRLYGLTFPVGQSIIEAQYYPLLTKVQDAIKKFDRCKVMIEGHTDSQGSDEVNLKLSESRAKAVAEYLMANMSVELGVNYQGFGESRPVASNDTPEGKAKNRRIDVVITPGWAVAGR